MKAVATGGSQTTTSTTQSTATSASSYGSNSARAETVSASSVTSFPDGTSLKFGSKGELVTLLQQLLTAKGYPVQATGNYYTLTTEAVRKYQAANNLFVDGVAGPRTLSHISGKTVGANSSGASSSSSSSSSNASSSTSGTLTGIPSLQRGSKGTQVKLLQERLNHYGASLKVDGDFGWATDAAVRAFQGANSLLADGVVGEKTAVKLNGSTAKSVSSSSGSSTSSSSSSTDKAYAAKAAIAIAAAKAQVGVPYKFNTATPGVNFDCSGLTMYAWGQAGVRLTHYSVAQAGETKDVTKETWLPGDLLFFHDPISHVSIYLGNGQHIQAPSEGKTVSINTLSKGNVVKVGRPKV